MADTGDEGDHEEGHDNNNKEKRKMAGRGTMTNSEDTEGQGGFDGEGNDGPPYHHHFPDYRDDNQDEQSGMNNKWQGEWGEWARANNQEQRAVSR